MRFLKWQFVQFPDSIDKIKNINIVLFFLVLGSKLFTINKCSDRRRNAGEVYLENYNGSKLFLKNRTFLHSNS